jgi:alkylhydroperoxidase family enzyme
VHILVTTLSLRPVKTGCHHQTSQHAVGGDRQLDIAATEQRIETENQLKQEMGMSLQMRLCYPLLRHCQKDSIMRLKSPRIPPLAPDEWDDTAREIMQPFVDSGRDYNVFRTLMNHPDLARRWLVFANHVLTKSTLPERDRELVILRVGHLCEAGYEWKKHAEIGRYLGMTEADIQSSRSGPDTPGIGSLDRLLLRATDELHSDSFIKDDTWASLAAHLSTEQLMDLVFTVGQYKLVSMALNSFGVQYDPADSD